MKYLCMTCLPPSSSSSSKDRKCSGTQHAWKQNPRGDNGNLGSNWADFKALKISLRGEKGPQAKNLEGYEENTRPLAETLSNLEGYLRGVPNLAA